MMTTLGLRVKMTGERLAHFSGRKRVGIRLRVSAVAVSEGTMRGETVRRRRPDETRDRHARVHTACARIRLACVSARAHCTIILFSIIVMIIILLYYILLSGQLLGERALRATRTGDYPDGTVGPENKKKTRNKSLPSPNTRTQTAVHNNNIQSWCLRFSCGTRVCRLPRAPIFHNSP